MNQLRNNVQLIGHVGKDPETITFEGDRKLVKFSLATSDRYKAQDGEWKSDTQWHNVVVWGKVAESIDGTIQKGNELAINGKLQYRQYTNKEGVKLNIAEINANELVKISKSVQESQIEPQVESQVES